MSRPVVVTNEQWLDIRSRIANDYGLSTSLLSWKMKEKLGFTARVHEEYSVAARQYQYQTCLDFYNEPKRTMFLLKYGDCIDRSCQETD